MDTSMTNVELLKNNNKWAKNYLPTIGFHAQQCISYLVHYSRVPNKRILFFILYFINCKVPFSGKVRSTFFP